MFQLTNQHLAISVLDPVADRIHLGSRYCTGGYIWQIEDCKGRPLMSGPCFPESDPPPFHGQGAPEVFVTTLGKDDCMLGEEVTVIGVGSVVRTSTTMPFHVRDNPTVREFCCWKVAHTSNTVTMSTLQKCGEASIDLRRTVILDEYTVVSQTEIVNTSSFAMVPLRWFPHPFFPLNTDLHCSKFMFPWNMQENLGYRKNAECMLCMKDDYQWNKGLFIKLEIPSSVHFSAHVLHPFGSSIEITSDYPLESLPVWANDRTFSLEPYMEGMVPPGERLTWKIVYRISI